MIANILPRDMLHLPLQNRCSTRHRPSRNCLVVLLPSRIAHLYEHLNRHSVFYTFLSCIHNSSTRSISGREYSPLAMALPVVAKVWDASNLFKTVVPYLPQLRTLPSQLVQSYNNWEALKAIYITTNPLITALGLSLFLAPIFLVVSEINKNYSQVDRCWSILPTIYNLHYCLWAHLTGLNTQRLDYVAAISIIWSVGSFSPSACTSRC